MPEIHDATTASGQAALFGFLGVGSAERTRMGEAALTRACLAQFARIFGPEAASPHATLWKDWAAGPLTATEADPASAGHPVPAETWVHGPWRDRLELAGSEISPHEAGYLAGAIEASERAVAAVSRRVQDRTILPRKTSHDAAGLREESLMLFNNPEVLFVMAAPSEYGANLRAVIDPLMIGVGPVEAAVNLTAYLGRLAALQRLPDLVVSLGSAGSRRLPQTEVFQVSAIAYRDMDVSVLGIERGGIRCRICRQW